MRCLSSVKCTNGEKAYCIYAVSRPVVLIVTTIIQTVKKRSVQLLSGKSVQGLSPIFSKRYNCRGIIQSPSSCRPSAYSHGVHVYPFTPTEFVGGRWAKIESSPFSDTFHINFAY